MRLGAPDESLTVVSRMATVTVRMLGLDRLPARPRVWSNRAEQVIGAPCARRAWEWPATTSPGPGHEPEPEMATSWNRGFELAVRAKGGRAGILSLTRE